MHPVEFTWYKAIVLIMSAIALGFGILNIIYFNRIRLNQDECTELSSGEATTALWLNIILVIFAAVLFFWSLFRLIFTGEEKKPIVNKQYNTIVHSPKAVASPIRIPSVPATPIAVATPVRTSVSTVTTPVTSSLATPSYTHTSEKISSTTVPYTGSPVPSYTHTSDKSPPFSQIYTYRASL